MNLFSTFLGTKTPAQYNSRWSDEIESQAKSWHNLLLLGFVVVYPIWSGLDYLLVPEHWIQFLVIRCVSVALIILLLLVQTPLKLSSKVSGYSISIILFLGLSWMLPLSGKAFDSYSLAMTIGYIGIALFLFWETPHSIINYMTGLALFFIMNTTFGNHDFKYSLSHGGLLLITVSLFSILIIAARLKIAKREFLTRLELENIRITLENKTIETKKVLEKLQLSNEIIQEELNIASEIQVGTLPELPFHSSSHSIVGHYQPLGKVGGDYFDFIIQDNKGIAVLIVDASGHGVPAALLTIMARIAFQESANQSNNPEDWLRHLNEIVRQTIRTKEYMTAQCLFFPNDAGPVKLANGAHRPAIHYKHKDGSVSEILAKGLIVGQFKDQDFMVHNSNIEMEIGDRLCLLTDGFEESRNQNGTPWGIKKVLDSFQKNWHSSIQMHKNRMLQDWRYFCNDTNLQDDCALLIIEKKK